MSEIGKLAQKKVYLNPEGICLIIAACESASVRVLKYDGLYLEFDRNVKAPLEITSPVVPAENASTLSTVAEMTDTQQSARSLLKHEVELKDDQLAEMWLTNPFEAEQLEINSQLEESNVGTQDET